MNAQEIKKAAPKSRHKMRILLGVFLLFALFWAGLNILLAPFLHSKIVNIVNAEIGREVSIGKVLINPYSLSIRLSKLVIYEPKENTENANLSNAQTNIFISADELWLDFSIATLWQKALVIDAASLINPRFYLLKEKSGAFNFADIVEKLAQQPKSAPFLFRLKNMQMFGGAISLIDDSSGKHWLFNQIAFALPFVSNEEKSKENKAEALLSGKLNGATLSLQAQFSGADSQKPVPIKVNLSDFAAAELLAVLPHQTNLQITSGVLNADLALLYNGGETPKLQASGDIQLFDFVAEDIKNQPFLTLKKGALKIKPETDFFAQHFVLGDALLEEAALHASLDEEGQFNLAQFIDNFPQTPAIEAQKEAQQKTFFWSLASFELKNSTLFWTQALRDKEQEKAQIANINFKINDLENNAAKDATFTAGFAVQADKWLSIEHFALTNGLFNAADKKMSAESLTLNNVKTLLQKSAEGEIIWAKLPIFASPNASKKTPNTKEKAWNFAVKNVEGKNMAFDFVDESFAPSVKQSVNRASFSLKNFALNSQTAAQMAGKMRVNESGEITFSGSLLPSALSAEIKFDAKNLPLEAFSPYAEKEFLVEIKDGQLQSAGKLSLSKNSAEKEAIHSEFVGDLSVRNLRLIDLANANDFLRAKLLDAKNINVRSLLKAGDFAVQEFSIHEALLNDFLLRLTVNEAGKFNLKTMHTQAFDNIKVPQNTLKNTVKNSALPTILITKIALQNGEIRFQDRFVKPNYNGNLRNINGTIVDLSAKNGARATAQLAALFDRISPLSAKATFNPFGENPYLSFTANLNDAELSPFSGYAEKYAGYPIRRGKLSLAANVNIADEKLTANNLLSLSQLDFGEEVPNNVSRAPLKLAVSILQDRRGQIELNLPVSGSFADPKFDLSGVMAQITANSIGKVLSSPFALIGAIFESEEELSQIEFAAGRAQITPEMEEQRLSILAQALLERAYLRMDIESLIATPEDSEGLKRARIDRKVRAQKREALLVETKKNQEEIPLSSVTVNAAEYPKYLKQVYEKAAITKPKNFIGLTKNLSVSEMEALLFTDEEIDEDDLYNLGLRRARAVRDWFIAQKIAANRLFVLPTQMDEKSAVSLVKFSLK